MPLVKFRRGRFELVRPPVAHALDDVSLTVRHGEAVGLVGESGCGKSTIGRIVAGIMPPSEGQVLWSGLDAYARNDRRAWVASSLKYQMVFQDPNASLNPRMKVGPQIAEAPLTHGLRRSNDIDAFVADLFAKVGLSREQMDRYPHQFSGGQRQRVAIARALSVNPELLICDEATASLDVSIQAQILNLMEDLRQELGLTFLFISHNMGVIEHFCDRVLVMYLGRIVEEAPTSALFARPNHPYTQALLAEVPKIEARKQHFAAIKGELPSPLAPPTGCHFHPRCPHAFDRCRLERPALKAVANGHLSACHLNDR
ncbi:MAG TPA: oligopeptide/dipeptide ABC transporter ATP-binding protein [Devosiaceae bacterium]